MIMIRIKCWPQILLANKQTAINLPIRKNLYKIKIQAQNNNNKIEIYRIKIKWLNKNNTMKILLLQGDFFNLEIRDALKILVVFQVIFPI